MATKKEPTYIPEEETPVVNEELQDEMRNVTVPYARPGEDKQIYMSINGRTWLIPCGTTVQLPRYAAEHLEHILRERIRYERETAETYNTQM